MREFHSGKSRQKVNFVDANNVAVGFDAEQNCCENFGWKFTDDPKGGNEVCDDRILEAYNFDPNFFHEYSEWDHGDRSKQSAVLKLVDEGKPDLFLTLFNSHNGYYSHGFECAVGGVVLHKGKL